MKKSNYDLNDEVIVITGGGGLIGSKLVEACLISGARVIIADISTETVEEAFLKFKNQGFEKIGGIIMDITSKESITRVIEKINLDFGTITALVNNAYPRNRNYGRKFFDVEFEDFCENVNMHLGGYFLCSQLFAKYFSKKGKGNIINISSIYGVVAPKFEIYSGTEMTVPVEYAAIKSGLIHLTKYMAKLLKSKNIRVNALSLGGLIDSQPESFLSAYKEECLNKGMLDTGDVVGSLLFLLSDASVYVNGQNLIVDDGFTL
jgi:NAD(P)-dependent dehydrogenase (short-subunit alcohol dehydrogenase family)